MGAHPSLPPPAAWRTYGPVCAKDPAWPNGIAAWSALEAWRKFLNQRDLAVFRCGNGERLAGWEHGVGGGFDESQRQLASSADGFLMALVGFYDLLHQAVADNVAFVEIDKADSFPAAQHLHGIAQTAALSGRQIDLRQVAGDHHLGIEAL